MRVCSKCGYIDSEYWHVSLKGCHYTRFEDFQVIEPLIASDLPSHRHVVDIDGLYVYHLTKGGYVERWAVIDKPDFATDWTMRHMERATIGRSNQRSDIARFVQQNRNQTKLLEISK